MFKFIQWATISTDDLREMNRLRSNKRLSVQTVLDWEAEGKKAEPELGSNSQKVEHFEGSWGLFQ